MNSEPRTAQAPDLHDIHARLRELHAQEYPNGAPHLYEQLLPRLPSYISALVRRKLDLLVRYELGRGTIKTNSSGQIVLRREDTDRSHADLTQGEKNALAMFLNPQVLRAYLDVGRDSALSNDEHSIVHFDTQPPVVANNLISVAASENPERLERMGCVFFDVDGTKTLVDCTSHAHTGKYLEALAEFLSKLEPMREWLKERKLKGDAYTVAGDEFIVVLRSNDVPLDKATLDEFAVEVQKAIAADAKLNSFITFDDDDFVMEYDEWTDEDRARYKANKESMSGRMRASREKLPEKFVPSVSSGSATFMEALREALSPDTETAKTLEDVGIDAFRLMVARADARLKEDKVKSRATMEDPKWKAFLLRNSENRRLQNEIDELRQQNLVLQYEVELLRRRILDKDALIAKYEAYMLA